jgi:hypothetical protein
MGLSVTGAPMHDPMTYSVQIPTGRIALQPFKQRAKGGVVIWQVEMLLDQDVALGVFDMKKASTQTNSLNTPR